MTRTYARLAEDNSAWLIVEDDNPDPGNTGMRQWVKVVGMGKTKKEAWSSYKNRAFPR